ncbi:unnamed protein product [Dibothriocephalus latus]|uniref:KY-like immunoglobulin-like domain-containing protein n=1 Tax=Dibothriocephalus latus TaxID=60516 RepID=A0A3P7LHH2_DIBLA|nr:unnamed protein product [Dibothriocephalus latus]
MMVEAEPGLSYSSLATHLLKEFESFVRVKPAFFKYNLSLLSHRKAVVAFTDPEIRIVVGLPSGGENFLFFDIKLTFDDKDFTEDYNGVSLQRYARHEFLDKENRLVFYVRPPKPGAYLLKIYVKHTQEEVTIASDGPKTVKQYQKVCDYGLRAKVPPNACLPPFPHTLSTDYGRAKAATSFNIGAVCRDGTVRATQGTVELRFSSLDSNSPLPQMMGKLKCTALSADAMKHCIVQRPLSNNTEFVFSIFLPNAGEYVLQVYASDPRRGGDSYVMVSFSFNFAVDGTGNAFFYDVNIPSFGSFLTQLWRYLLISDQASPVCGLPSLPPDYLGPGPKFAELGLSTVSHSDPFIRADTGELCVRLAYQESLPLKWKAKLIFAKNDSSDDCSNMVS